jgi:hypothetical protein
MVLEKTVSPCDVEKIVVDTFGKDSLSLVINGDTIVLTRAPSSATDSELATISEKSLAAEWLLPEEDEAWKFL